MSRARSSRRGFTLIEVLVAVAVLGVTMAAVAGLFGTGLRLRSVARDHMAFEHDARAFLTALRDDCANLVTAAPGPVVTGDAIVLWRFVAGSETRPGPQAVEVVTYQWSVSDAGDSLLTRVASPLTVDAADGEAVRDLFRQWAGTVEDETALAPTQLVRQGTEPRFGPAARRGDVQGRWLAFPGVKAAAFALGDGFSLDSDASTPPGSRIRIKLGDKAWAEAASLPDPVRRYDLLPVGRTGVTAAVRLPQRAELLVAEAQDTVGEVWP
jgi:prepilin-type N-terminal cleavage/methylation domain-containing protein